MIPEEATKLIGNADPPRVFEVEKGAIKKYADAVGDRNPLYWDEEYARKSRYGSIIAPPGFAGWPVKWTEAMPFITSGGIMDALTEIMTKDGHPFILDGGAELEFKFPVRAGDILVSSGKFANIRERDSKGTKMFFCTWEIDIINQNGDVVLRTLQTMIFR